MLWKSCVSRLYCLFFLMVLIIGLTAGSAAESTVVSDIEMISEDVTGPGSNNSIYDNGISYNGSLNFTNRSEIKKYDLLFNLNLRSQEDMQSSEQVLLLSRLRASLSSKDNNSVFNIGDTFEYFDQYVLNSSLKGVSYKYKTEKNDALTFIFGYDYPRWENVFNDDYQAISRRSMGLDYKNSGHELFKWGFSVLNTDDEKAIEPGDILYKNNLIGLNWEYLPIPGLTVQGSSAYGKTEEKGSESYSGTAHKIRIFSNASEGRASIDYERVAPQFKTLLGSATADREKYKASLLYRYSDRINYNFDYLYFHDNLDGQKGVTTHNYKPGIGVSVKRIFDRRYASAGLKYNLNIKEAGEKKIDEDIIAVNYRDRFKMIDLNMNINYAQEKAEIEDDISQENELTYNLSLSTRKRMEGYILRPVLRLGYFKNNDEVEDENDVNFEKSLELGLDIPDKRISSSIRLGEREAKRDAGEDNNKLFADLSIYYRPEFLDKYNQGRVYLRYRYNDLSYSENKDNDLRENSLTAGINLGF